MVAVITPGGTFGQGSPAIHRSGARDQSPRLKRTTMQLTVADLAITELGGEGHRGTRIAAATATVRRWSGSLPAAHR